MAAVRWAIALSADGVQGEIDGGRVDLDAFSVDRYNGWSVRAYRFRSAMMQSYFLTRAVSVLETISVPATRVRCCGVREGQKYLDHRILWIL